MEEMDIPINAEVHCTDGLGGHSTYVVLDPITQEITHLVVKGLHLPHTEFLVPIERVSKSTAHTIQLDCTKAELNEMDHFIKTEFIQSKIPRYTMDPYMAWPYYIPESRVLTLEHEQIPAGEMAVRRGAQVEATDGHVGRVDGFLVNPENEHITHLVLREGHLWGHKDVTIPVSQIDYLEEDIVYLELDKASIEALPSIPIGQ
ncbi:MAG: PRC-barrel domain-containing protein [Chloroflexota bacterium]|jgi:sporulation protein YlmC with PRC-barrel domain